MSSTREAESKAQRLFDVRTIERNIKKGTVTRKDYEKHLKALADAAEKVAPPEEHPDDIDDDDDLDDDLVETNVAEARPVEPTTT